MINKPIDWRRVARYVLLSRELDSFEEQQLAPLGKVKYQFSAKGHELSQVLLAQALNHSHDAATVYYRSRPLLLASGMDATTALAAGMALSNTPSQGRDTGVIYHLLRRSGLTVLPASGNVGAQFTPAAGWAQAILYHQQVLEEQDWKGALAVAHGGDGSTATNGFWSALNITTTQNLPVLFFIEDNSYSLSVPGHLQTPGGNIAANLASFQGLKVLDSDGTDPQAAWQAISHAVEYLRRGEGACLLRLKVPRLQGHTYIDDQAYKASAELRAEMNRDPVIKLQEFLEATGEISHDAWVELREEIREEVSACYEVAVQNPSPDLSKVKEHIFFTGTPPRNGGLRPENALPEMGSNQPQPTGPRINLIDAVRRTLTDEMDLNPRILVFGEDVGVKGGVHGATRDMQHHFGDARVFDTSLSEEGIIGRSLGFAYAGLLPVPEIQFRKYADPAFEQITDFGTVRWRTANQFAAPVVVRIPVGYGKTTGDPWHSVTGEAIYAHTLGWRIAFPSNAEDAAGLLRSALRGDDPTFFLEHRALLDTAPARRPYPGDDYCLPFGIAKILVAGDELTLISWGEAVHRCLAASQSFPGRVMVVDLRTIIPWDKETVLECVRKTGKVLIVHEDTLTAGFGAEISAVINEQAFTDLDAPIHRLATPDVPIPYNVDMMEYILPNQKKIEEKINELLGF
ncbi:MAG: alpha-ketoacid dehydrogenase subunit alpha/beta [Anaerolineales bacterium]